MFYCSICSLTRFINFQFHFVEFHTNSSYVHAIDGRDGARGGRGSWRGR